MIKEDIINDFIELIKINSQSKNERKIADSIKKKLLEIGCEVFEDNTGDVIGGNTGNIIAKLQGDLDISPILFSAHMDRVKKGDNINPTVDGETIKSDGSTILAADDVAGIVSILDGIKQIKAEGIKHGDIEIIFSVCEEQGIMGSKYLDYGKIKSKMAYVLDSPGRIGRIVNQAPAKKKITVKIYGKPAHAGNEPEKGINAIKVAGTALAELDEGRINKHTTSNFGIIKGGSATNVVCDYVEIVGEARSTNRDDLKNYVEYLKTTFEDVCDRYKTYLEIEIEDNYDTFHVKEDELVCKIITYAMSALGIDCYFSYGGGGMDANRFNQAGISSIGIATGYSKNHTLDEEIYIEDLIKSGDLVKQIIIEASKLKRGSL